MKTSVCGASLSHLFVYDCKIEYRETENKKTANAWSIHLRSQSIDEINIPPEIIFDSDSADCYIAFEAFWDTFSVGSRPLQYFFLGWIWITNQKYVIACLHAAVEKEILNASFLCIFYLLYVYVNDSKNFMEEYVKDYTFWWVCKKKKKAWISKKFIVIIYIFITF